MHLRALFPLLITAQIVQGERSELTVAAIHEVDQFDIEETDPVAVANDVLVFGINCLNGHPAVG